MRAILTLLAAALMLAATSTTALGQGAPKPMEVDWTGMAGVPSGSATKTSPWIFYLLTPPAKAGDKPKYEKIEIKNLPRQMVGESVEAASKRKAEAVEAAINAKLGAGRATVAQKMVELVIGLDAFGRPIKKTFNMSFVTVTGLYSVPDKPGFPGTGKPTFYQPPQHNPTLEFGDGGRVGPAAGGGGGAPSPGYSPGMGFLPSKNASGVETVGLPSFVDFGVLGGFVAAVRPTTGESPASVLEALGAELDAHGLPTVFNPSTDMLYFVHPLGPHEFVEWSSTDTGLKWTTTLTAAVPEPATWLLLILGAGLVGGAARRRRVSAA